MDRINYAGESFLTGSAIARALLDYAQALAEVGSSGTADIPTVDVNGREGSVTVLVGPASQLISATIDSDHPEPADEGLVEQLHTRAADLRTQGATTARPQVPESPPSDDRSDFI